jgi:PAS domain-containing protein
MLLANSLDAIAVINTDRRFVGANGKALDLFGISETNMGKFTIDAFFSHGQTPKFDSNGLPVARRAAKHGKCEIRRLDGSLRIAEYIFVAHFAPFRHLCRFRNVTAINQYRSATLRTAGNQSVFLSNHDRASQRAPEI